VGRERYTLIDGLRGVAALSVLCWHYQHFFVREDFTFPKNVAFPLQSVLGPFYSAGYFGVQIFWVISGFVFSVVYRGSRSSSRQFFINRFSRLYPLHWLTLLVVVVLQAFAMWKVGRWLIYDNNDAYHFVLQLFYASGWGLERGYSFNGPTWSVSAEILIYVAFWLVHRWLGGVWQPALVALGFMVLNVLVGGNISNCGVYFFLGCTTAAVFKATKGRLSAVIPIAGVFAASSLVLHRFDSPYDPAGIAMGMVLALAGAEAFAPNWLRRAGAAAGDCSYGVYLWHVPVQLTLFVIFGSAVPSLAMHGWFLGLFFGLTIGCAAASFIAFERPVQSILRERLASTEKRRATA
jgi:peptidoglycan/LPS O-acetylase OafA/YrhL